MAEFLRYLREVVQDRELVLLSFIAGIAVLMTPLQRQMSLSRFQHYSLGIFVIALGCLLQAVISWRHVSWWGRLALLSCAIYLASFGSVCYTNPWLDWSFDLQTSLQGQTRQQFSAYFFIAGLPVATFWYRWALDRYLRKQAKKGKDQPEQVSS